MMNPEPQKEHRWLHKLVGNWTYDTDAGDGKTVTGTECVRSIGGIWVQAEGRGPMPGDGDPSTTIATLGYNPATGRFVGTWIGSMMTHMWVYDGELDADEKVLTLNCVGPAMDGSSRMDKYQDIIEFKSDNLRTLTARVLTNEGWQQMMMIEYRRQE